MKDKLIKSTFLLLIGGIITKILGMFIKISMARTVGPETLGLYMMILPTFSLFIGLSQLGLPIALAKLVAEDKKNNKRLFFSVIPVDIALNLILMLFIILVAPFIAKTLLHNNDTYFGIISIALVIPFTSISSIARSYFFGKGKMGPHIISNIVEDSVRLTIILFFAKNFVSMGNNISLAFLILCNIVSELASILILFFFLPKKFALRKEDIKLDYLYIRESLSIGIPNTAGRFVGSIGYFLEPIVLMHVLTRVGYSSFYITHEYGVLSGFVMPILLLPSFFTGAISQALMPIVSKDFSDRKVETAKRKIKLGVYLSAAIGAIMMVFFMVFAKTLLNIFYQTNHGVSYMKVLAPVCFLQYLQAPLGASLQALGKNKELMIANILGVIVRTASLFLFSFLRIGIWGLILGIGINVIVVTGYSAYQVKKCFQ